MSDIYKIAVSLAMTSNAPAFLSSLAAQILHVHTHVKDLEGSLMRLSRIKLAVGGGLAVAAGGFVIEGLAKTVEAAKELNHQLTTTGTLLANTSRNPMQSQALQAQAMDVARATANAVHGISLDKAVEIFNESYSIVGAKNAASINEMLARYAKVAGAAAGDPEKGYEGIRELLKSGEMSGKIMNEQTHLVDTAKLEAYLGIAAKMTAVSAGRVNARTFFQVASQGSTALKGMDDDGLMSMLMAAQQMGGFKVGTASMSMFSQFAAGKMTKPVAEELHKLGLVGEFSSEGKGGALSWKPGALETTFTKQLLKDPLSSIETLRKAMSSHGIVGEEAQTKELFKILGRQTTQRLITDFMTNMENMVAEKGRAKGAMDLRTQDKTRDDQDFDANVNNLKTAFGNLMDELGLPQMKSAIGILQTMTGALDSLRATVVKIGPENIANIGKGLAIFGAALIGAGGVAILAALGPAGWLVLGIGALAGAFKAFAPKQFDEWWSGFKTLMHGLATFNWSEICAGIAKEFGAVFGLLPDKVRGAIEGAMQGIADIFIGSVRWLKNLLPKSTQDDQSSDLPGVEPQTVRPQSYDGTGFGNLLKTISYGTFTGGGANDNAKAVVSGGISGGLTNCNVVVLGGAGGLGGGSFGGGSGGGGLGGGGGHFGGGGRISPASAAATGPIADYIRATAARLGIDPKVAVAVANSEALRVFDPNRPDHGGDNGTSFGPYQLHYGGGLGDVFTRMTGLNARDPSTWKKQVEFALGWARKHGWTPWHGAANTGIGAWQGIGTYSGPAPRLAGPPPSRKPDTVIHNKVHLDGKVVAQNTTRHQAQDMMFPTEVGGFDSHGYFASPGTPLLDAA